MLNAEDIGLAAEQNRHTGGFGEMGRGGRQNACETLATFFLSHPLPSASPLHTLLLSIFPPT